MRNAGVLAYTAWPDDASKVLIEQSEKRMSVIGDNTVNFHILMKLGLSKIIGISYSPPVQESAATEELLDKLNEQIFNSILMDAYSELSGTLRKEIQSLKKKGRKIDLFIPPIPAILLNKVSRP